MDRHMQHSVFHTIAFLAFSCLAISTLASWCCKFMSRIFSVPGVSSKWPTRRQHGLYTAAYTQTDLPEGSTKPGQYVMSIIALIYRSTLFVSVQCSVVRCEDVTTGFTKKIIIILIPTHFYHARYNASTLCFCTTLCQLTCRNYDHPTFLFYLFLVFNPGDLYYLRYKKLL